MPRNLTQGSIVKALFSLAAPIVAANILQTAYQLTDTFWVGRLGEAAVAAVSMSFPIIFLMIALVSGFAIAGTIMVAQFKGRGDQQRLDHVAAQTLVANIMVSIVIAVAGYFASPMLMRLMGAPPAVLPEAVAYLQVTFVGMVFLFSYFTFQSLLRGVGEVKTPFVIVLGTVLLNLGLDPLFILGYGPIPALGVAGAALATIFTQGIAAVIGLWLLFSGRYGVHLRIANLPPDWALLKRLVKLGGPSSIEQSTRAFGMAVMMTLVAGFGATPVAAYGVFQRVVSFIIIPAMGFSMASTTLVGQNIGAGLMPRAVRSATLSAVVSFVVLTLAGAVAFVFAHPLIAAFIPGVQPVIAEGGLILEIAAFSFGLIGVQMVLLGAMRGAGATVAAMTLTLVSFWILRLPMAWGLSLTSLNELGIWVTLPASNVLSVLLTCLWFARGSWQRHNVMGKASPRPS
ncbi:MAG TPA: MATE family efflux transporter [Gammaproteobacteria bacterium]|nr:MATE family efflux transporter [Gammaproteobacteria bacterium]